MTTSAFDEMVEMARRASHSRFQATNAAGALQNKHSKAISKAEEFYDAIMAPEDPQRRQGIFEGTVLLLFEQMSARLDALEKKEAP